MLDLIPDSGLETQLNLLEETHEIFEVIPRGGNSFTIIARTHPAEPSPAEKTRERELTVEAAYTGVDKERLAREMMSGGKKRRR